MADEPRTLFDWFGAGGIPDRLADLRRTLADEKRPRAVAIVDEAAHYIGNLRAQLEAVTRERDAWKEDARQMTINRDHQWNERDRLAARVTKLEAAGAELAAALEASESPRGGIYDRMVNDAMAAWDAAVKSEPTDAG